MDDKELKQKLDTILEKRSKCIPLTKIEEIRKAVDLKSTAAFKSQQFRGGYSRMSDVPERVEATGDKSQGTGDPIREDNRHTTDNKEEKVPTEDNSGTIKGDYLKEEYADTDNKAYQPYYEEDRLSDQIQGQHNYSDSIRVKDVVIKTLRAGNKLVGQVLKVYPAVKGNQAALVKWANGTFNHELVSNLQVLRPVEKAGKAKKTEDEYVSPPVKKKSIKSLKASVERLKKI